jgi:hypothetical protein
MPRRISSIQPSLTMALACAGLSLFAACAGKKTASKSTVTLNLDSLHQVNEHNDSVESNLMFYEHAFDDYHSRFPGVDKPNFMSVAKGKDQDFCLFKPNPAQTCLDVADKFNDLNLKQPARDAYLAGLVSEGTNESRVNVRLWGSMAQLCREEMEYDAARMYIGKVLEVEPKNKWAKKLLDSVTKH